MSLFIIKRKKFIMYIFHKEMLFQDKHIIILCKNDYSFYFFSSSIMNIFTLYKDMFLKLKPCLLKKYSTLWPCWKEINKSTSKTNFNRYNSAGNIGDILSQYSPGGYVYKVSELHFIGKVHFKKITYYYRNVVIQLVIWTWEWPDVSHFVVIESYFISEFQ